MRLTKNILTSSLVSLLLALHAFAADPAAFTTKVTGHGRPMILIPGLASPGDVWDGLVHRFQDRFECHVLSLAGFAGAPVRKAHDDRGPLLAAVRAELAAYVRDRGLERPVVIGHSLGGFLALDLAVNHPELVGPLVIVDGLPFVAGVMQPGAKVEDAKRIADATAQAFSRMDAETYARMIRSGPNGSTMASREADLERIIGWGLASDPATVAAAMKEMYGADLRPALAQIKSPTLVLAAWVGYAPYSSHERVAQIYGEQFSALKNVRIEISDTARHFIMLDEPEWTAARIAAFLDTRRVADGDDGDRS